MTREQKTILIQALLFVVTFISTTFAGAFWCYGKTVFYGFALNADFTWHDFVLGMNFSIPFLLVLTVHEFGHYFTAIAHKVRTSLPYYIPVPPNPLLPTIGTFGAVIRIRERVKSNIQHFDIGLA